MINVYRMLTIIVKCSLFISVKKMGLYDSKKDSLIIFQKVEILGDLLRLLPSIIIKHSEAYQIRVQRF